MKRFDLKVENAKELELKIPEDIAGLNATNYGCARSNGTSSVLFVNETSMTSAGGGGTNFASTGTITNKFTSFTICGWIYQVGNVNGFFGVSQGTNPPGAHFGINISRATNQTQVTIYNPAVGGSYDDYSAFFPTYGTNGWTHFAFTWNSNHVGTIYLGGIERTNTYSFAGTRPSFLPVQPLMFGRTSGTASRWTTNNYDDWRIYSEVLSSSRIWRIANKAERLQ